MTNPGTTLMPILSRQRAAFMAAPRPTLQERRDRLVRLARLLKDNQASLATAVSADFGNRSVAETILAEIATLLDAVSHARRSLAGWMRPQRRRVSLSAQPARNRVEYVPLGVVGIVAPWNYPVYLTLGPLVDVLAAGNRCMIKPSELTPRTAALLERLLAQAFAAEEVAVVQGDAAVARAFCALPFDHLLYTGSTRIGREVMAAAAENLVPVTLELGGKSPVIVAGDFDMAKAGASVAAGKFFNAGQTCVSPDYALVPDGSVTAFGQAALRAATAMFPALSGNPDCTTIVSDRHFLRLRDLVAEAEAAGATVLRHPAAAESNARVFPPTVVLDPPETCRLMQEEVFGPVLPVLGMQSLEAAIGFVNARPRPLALYLYARDAQVQRAVLDRTMSGGVTVNGTMMHVGQATLPFGGIGPSGMGCYHGYEGFLRFSHARAVHWPGRFSGFEALRPPHGRRMRLLLRAVTGFKAD